MRGPLETSVPPTSAGSAATALESTTPPRSARLAVPVFARSGRNWLSAGGAGHGSVSGRDNRRSSGTWTMPDRKSTRLNSSHLVISYAVFCLKKKKNEYNPSTDEDTLYVLSHSGATRDDSRRSAQ